MGYLVPLVNCLPCLVNCWTSFTPWKVIWGHFMPSSVHRTFLLITFDRKEIETWKRCQSVRLIKTHHLIYNMAYFSHFVTLTSGDLGWNLQIDLSRSKLISVDPAWRVEHNGVKIISLFYVVQKLLIKLFPPKNVILTFDGLWCAHYWSNRQAEGTGW